MPHLSHRVAILDADPDLAADLARADLLSARPALLAPCIRIEPGPCPVDGLVAHGPDPSLLVLDGLLLSDVALAGSRAAELIGPGDVFGMPAQWGIGETFLPLGVELTVLESTRVAVLDEQFQRRCARWPSVNVALLERAQDRAARLARQAAICSLPAVHLRLLAIFWHLADRWGRVTPDHVVVPLSILHRTLGSMIGAERSTVSLALRQLASAGLVTRRDDGAWLLKGDPGDSIRDLTGRASRPAASLLGGAEAVA